MATSSTTELARTRAERAEQLEAAIAALGVALDAYRRVTSALEFRADLDLSRYLQNAITLHLAKAGLSEYLERRLVGPAPSLRSLVEAQHQQSGQPALQASRRSSCSE